MVGLPIALGSGLGLAQYLLLRRKLSRGALWIEISFICLILAGLVSIPLLWIVDYILYAVGVLCFGTVLSALGMSWLLKENSA